MPEIEYTKPDHHLGELHAELIAAGVTTEYVRGEPDGDRVWITAPADQAALVASVVNSHDGIAYRLAEAWRQFRIVRTELLRACDYVDLPNTPIDNRAAWLTYRQALRDLPQTHAASTDPAAIVFPESPTE